METEEGVELQEDGEVGGNGSGRKDPVGEFLKARRGGAEITVVSACYHCGRKLSNGLVPLSVSRELSAEHLKEEHPEITPRDIKSIRREFQESEKVARKRQNGKKGKTGSVVSMSGRSWKTKQPRSKSGPPSRQPELTAEMIEKMRFLYSEVGSIRKVTGHYYGEFGFSSPERLRDALSKARQERGVILGIPRNRHRLTEKTIEEAMRLYGEEKMSLREISKRHHADWGYSLNGLRNTLQRIFRDRGVELRKDQRRTSGKSNRMTPERVEVAWRLYSAGNYSLQEIGEISYEPWGYKTILLPE